MDALEAATLLKLWAAEKGFISKERFVGPFEEQLDDADMAAVPLGANAVQIFHARGINFVGFNEDDRKVIVFTNKKLTKKERAALPQDLGDDITIDYRQGNLGSAGPTPGAPFGQGPYHLHQGRYTCGSSIMPATHWSAGTLGCLVRDQANELYGLSCNHVTGLCNFAEPGIPILAPSGIDVRVGGCDPFTLGHHYALLPQLDGIPQNVPIQDNTDAAIFRLRDPALVSSMQRDHYDTPAQVVTPRPGMTVEKVGRTSGRTAGIIRAQTAGPEPITYQLQVIPGSMKIVFFNPLFVIEGTGTVFAEGGDSGSLVTTVVNGVRHATAIISGVNSQNKLAFVLPLGPILARLNLTLVNGHNA